MSTKAYKRTGRGYVFPVCLPLLLTKYLDIAITISVDNNPTLLNSLPLSILSFSSLLRIYFFFLPLSFLSPSSLIQLSCISFLLSFHSVILAPLLSTFLSSFLFYFLSLISCLHYSILSWFLPSFLPLILSPFLQCYFLSFLRWSCILTSVCAS